MTGQSANPGIRKCKTCLQQTRLLEIPDASDSQYSMPYCTVVLARVSRRRAVAKCDRFSHVQNPTKVVCDLYSYQRME
jgi:hypothetical protein